jgi:hypothetical protein
MTGKSRKIEGGRIKKTESGGKKEIDRKKDGDAKL